VVEDEVAAAVVEEVEGVWLVRRLAKERER
jgi:hypothetical protein